MVITIRVIDNFSPVCALRIDGIKVHCFCTFLHNYHDGRDNLRCSYDHENRTRVGGLISHGNHGTNRANPSLIYHSPVLSECNYAPLDVYQEIRICGRIMRGLTVRRQRDSCTVWQGMKWFSRSATHESRTAARFYCCFGCWTTPAFVIVRSLFLERTKTSDYHNRHTKCQYV